MRVTRQKQIITDVVVVQMFQRPVPVGDVALRNVSLGSGVKGWVWGYPRSSCLRSYRRRRSHRRERK